ncbi:YhdP family protein [Saccharospirillum salsuginis]|uniref:TIGR02099 family protein n=1 Tax=Saccharospirillum salsuginis TaxID=418750 RepID=A0A918KGY4_9GAMM|nr:YhdP family protein [Saccharospirillum salsuginis]GGX63151.1 TIGR02099 family protein [Saccharospirillum salsuginis]
MAASSFFKTLGTVLLKVAAFWVLLVAAYLALGRQFFPYIERYTDQVEAILSQQLGTDVSIGELTGEWRQFNPILIAERVRIGDTLAVRRVLVEPSLLQSLVNLSPVFKRFELTGFIARLEQQPDGWRMTGLTGASPGDRLSIDRLSALLRQQREVMFEEVRLQIEPRYLPGMTVVMDQGRMTGYGEDNWLRANARLLYNDLEVPLELQLESTLQAGDYDVELYARHGQLDFAPWLATRWPGMSELHMAGEYWAHLENNSWQNLTVRLFGDRTRLAGTESDLVLSDIETELYAERTTNGFDLWVNHLGHRLQVGGRAARDSAPVKARLSKRGTQWQAQWDRLPVAPLSGWLALNDGSRFWSNAFPTGQLRQGKLTVNTEDWQSLRLTAEVTEATLRPYAGIPGIDRIQGDLRVEGPVARLNYDQPNVTVALPDLYRGDFRFNRLNGHLNARWWPGLGVQLEGRNQGRVAPDAGQENPVSVSNHWQVDLPPPSVVADGEREVNLRLAIEAPEADRDWAVRLTPDEQIGPIAKPWIRDNLLAADLSDLQFVYAGGFREGRPVQAEIGLTGRFDQARVQFDEAWPVIEQGSGRVGLNLASLTVSAETGRMGGIELEQGTLRLPFQDNRVNMTLDATGDSGEALALFQDGPLAELGQGVVDDWRTEGRARARLDLSVPFDGGVPEVRLTGRLDGTRLVMPEYDLDIRGIEGDINYNDRQGLFAEQLIGQVFGTPHRLALRTEENELGMAVELDVEGDTPLDGWGRWLGDPWLAAQAYRVPAEARIRIEPDGTDINIRSTLLNLPLDAPEPLGKAANEAEELALRIRFDQRDWMRLDVDYNRDLDAYFEFDANQTLQRGSVALGRPLKVHDDSGVFFDAHLDRADVEAWWNAIDSVIGHYTTENSGEVDASQTDWVREINLSGGQWTYLGLDWNEPTVQVQRNSDAWLANVEAREGRGRILIPHKDEPLFADIAFLSLTTPDGTEPDETELEDEVDPLRQARPSDVPAMSIQVAQLSIDDRDFGNWRAEVVQGEGEVRAENLVGDMTGARLGGTLVWRYEDAAHRSRFDGDVTTGNINTLLRSWGYAPVLVSENGQFELDLDWAGSPAFFDFARLRGRIGLQLNNGAILELDEYEGVKLIGLLNFTRVLRRLALDFSDLIRDGITYDTIEGELLFDRGFARVGEKLVIDGPATKFRFSGDADLIRDQLDVDMVMTVPLSSTFPLVALLAGVSPQAAAAIYVTERVFNNELERLSSARMHVTGSLDEPEIRFYRVFDNSSGQQAPSVGDRLKNVVPGSNNP